MLQHCGYWSPRPMFGPPPQIETGTPVAVRQHVQTQKFCFLSLCFLFRAQRQCLAASAECVPPPEKASSLVLRRSSSKCALCALRFTEAGEDRRRRENRKPKNERNENRRSPLSGHAYTVFTLAKGLPFLSLPYSPAQPRPAPSLQSSLFPLHASRSWRLPTHFTRPLTRSRCSLTHSYPIAAGSTPKRDTPAPKTAEARGAVTGLTIGTTATGPPRRRTSGAAAGEHRAVPFRCVRLFLHQRGAVCVRRVTCV